MPKTVANSSKLINVSTEQKSTVKVVEEDPVYLFYYEKLYPEENVRITYKVGSKINQSLADSLPTPILAAGPYEEQKTVTTPATTTTIPPKEEKKGSLVDYGIILLGIGLIMVGIDYYIRIKNPKVFKRKSRRSRKKVKFVLKYPGEK